MKPDYPAKPLGRTLRLFAGIFLIAAIWSPVIKLALQPVLRLTGVVLVLVIIYMGIHWLVDGYIKNMNRWTGALLALLPVIFFYVMGSVYALGVILYIGVSLLIAGLTGDAGCEVMVIPGLFFGKQVHLACLFFSPIDWLERKFSR